MTARKAFLSHASEDKDSFVIEFATKLREKGVDTWLDGWEIKAGDSIVKKVLTQYPPKGNSVLRPVLRSFCSGGVGSHSTIAFETAGVG